MNLPALIPNIYNAHSTYAFKATKAPPTKIFNGWADPKDITNRIDDMEHVFDTAITYLMALARDLNDNLPVTSKVDLADFVQSCEGAFGDVVGEFAAIGRELEEEYGR